MTTRSSGTDAAPKETPLQPNDDGFVLGTAGRDEDPNATTDWDRDDDSAGRIMTTDDAHGLPGYPRDKAQGEAGQASKEPDHGERKGPDQGNNDVD